MKTKFKKNYLSLAISAMLLAIANSSGAKNTGGSVNSAQLPGHPASASTTTLLVSINSAGTDSGNQFSDFSPTISANGRLVAFFSYASNLVENDTNNNSDIFLRDIKTGVTTLASINSAGTASGNKGSQGPAMNADGRFVAFTSSADNLVTNDTGYDTSDVFVRNIKTGVTTLVSINNAGTASGNHHSASPVLSADGRFVAFSSKASNLVANDANDTWDIFVHDLKTGITKIASTDIPGLLTGSFDSLHPALSANGRFVAFQTVESDFNPFFVSNLFIHDLNSRATKLVSVDSTGTASGNNDSYLSGLSANGRFVVFSSYASNLVENDTNNNSDIFLRDIKTGVTTLVSINSAGTASGNGNSGSLGPAISADGRLVAFSSSASDLVANDTNGSSDVFVRDLKTGTTRLVSINSAGTAGGNDDSFASGISANGRFVGFTSLADDLVTADTPTNTFTGELFVRDLKTGTTTLVSINSAGTASGNGTSDRLVLSADGRFVAFNSDASDLVTNDTNGTRDIFVRPTTK